MVGMPATPKDRTLLVHGQGASVQFVVVLILDPASLDLSGILSELVPGLARQRARGGLVVVGDSTLILRNTGDEVLVEEVATRELLGVAGIQHGFDPLKIEADMVRWIRTLSRGWPERAIGRLRELLVPNLVSALAGEVASCDGVWGRGETAGRSV
jgi:hypothetical protein